MASRDTQLHVVFGRSAAATLQQSLKVASRDGIVVAPYDDFSFGPIASDDAIDRGRWVEAVLGYSDWQRVSLESLPVLSASMEAYKPPIAWVSPDSAQSVAGFLWWLSHMGGRECLVLEVSGLNLLGPDDMSKHIDRAELWTFARRASSLAAWKKLQAEDAPLRVLGRNGLVSAPIEYFDQALLGHTTPEWQKMARIVAGVLSDFHVSGIFQTGDLVLAARLTDLAEAGILGWRGDLGHMARCEMRLPQ
ncbi:hypothetical protein S2M10_39970 [Sphingomonas sp. S2M10]|uniref:DUF3658 domain-containing protein n=1 Tax=Sphingomonas sp. S2M10 TaxID=2705010 RepID=UPI001457756F|nr:DUF3658 domain-containing protein [Sphingomonas sp. S2M10]NLS28983.1 hypothetical protein [Sphingomonas sp. S2M10]